MLIFSKKENGQANKAYDLANTGQTILLKKLIIVLLQKRFVRCYRSSGLNRRQCAGQLTIFTGVRLLPKFLIFRGEGKRIKIDENRCWDKRVIVKFQQKAWYDEKTFIKLIREQLGNFLLNLKNP